MFSDFERGSPMLILFIVYALLVIAVARWRGAGALLGLALAFGVVMFFTIPALFDGGDPSDRRARDGSGRALRAAVSRTRANARTTTAYLGTLAGLSVTAVLAWWAVGASKFTGVWTEARHELWNSSTRASRFKASSCAGSSLRGSGCSTTSR